ncbi:MAG: spore Coat Protein domain protein [Nevskia sp.]|nr:spore Coat Protein domain protein [Nevskia sp.]
MNRAFERTASGVALLAALLSQPGLFAAEANGQIIRTTTFVVSVVVDGDCWISGSRELSFGHVHAQAGGGRFPMTRQLTHFGVSCSPSTRYSLALDRGDVRESSIADRLMAASSAGNRDTLRYQLFTDANFSSVWGDGTSGGANTVSSVGNGATQLYTVYAEIPSQQMPVADLYSSTITASLSF